MLEGPAPEVDTSIIFQQHTWAGELEGRCWINATPRPWVRAWVSERTSAPAGRPRQLFLCNLLQPRVIMGKTSAARRARAAPPNLEQVAQRPLAAGPLSGKQRGEWEDRGTTRPGGLTGITQPWGLLPKSRPSPRVACCCPAHCLPPAPTSDHFPAKSTTLFLHSPHPFSPPPSLQRRPEGHPPGRKIHLDDFKAPSGSFQHVWVTFRVAPPYPPQSGGFYLIY